MLSSFRINPRILEMEYAVRGPIPLRAAEMARAGRKIIPCNIGNPQALGQKPLSYYRQVLSILENPGLLDISGVFPEEVRARAAGMLEASRTGVGAYSESAGFRFIREDVARFIDQRDKGGVDGDAPAADPDAIFLTDGASGGAVAVIEALICDGMDGVLVPVPQYPLYSATMARCGGRLVPYYPDEDSGWSLNRSILEEALEGARREGIRVKAVVVINPGNPTGALLDLESMRELLEVAEKWGLAVIADEVYQENTYGAHWYSFASVLGKREIPLFSLHSVSKGFYGECGHRGGYLEVRNPPKVEGRELDMLDILLKQASVNLCPNSMGQMMVDLMVRGPEEHTESESIFLQEKEKILGDLETKAAMIRKAFDEMEGVRCFGRTGAMYLFPRLEKLPEGKSDFDYCMALLEETGLVTVNGGGFGQAPGTSHLRIAFLPPVEAIEEMLPRWIGFHRSWISS